MGLPRPTVQKLLREDFPGSNPIVVPPAEKDHLVATVTARLERIHDLDSKSYAYLRDEEKPRLVYSFSIIDPEPYYYHGSHTTFRLMLDVQNRLTITEVHEGDSAVVSDLEEVVRFVAHCKERLDRKQALKAQRGKVRELLAQAILAQVRKVAREEHFEFMSETDATKLNLFVKLSDEHAVVLHIPFKEFKKFLPQLRTAIVTLRELYDSGIRFQIVGRGGLPWRKTWTTPDSLQ